MTRSTFDRSGKIADSVRPATRIPLRRGFRAGPGRRPMQRVDLQLGKTRALGRTGRTAEGPGVAMAVKRSLPAGIVGIDAFGRIVADSLGDITRGGIETARGQGVDRRDECARRRDEEIVRGAIVTVEFRTRTTD